jgi:hypothetical protein
MGLCMSFKGRIKCNITETLKTIQIYEIMNNEPKQVEKKGFILELFCG